MKHKMREEEVLRKGEEEILERLEGDEEKLKVNKIQNTAKKVSLNTFCAIDFGFQILIKPKTNICVLPTFHFIFLYIFFRFKFMFIF